MSELKTVKEVAATLKLSAKQVYQMLREGSLAHVKIGGTLRVPAQDLEALLQASYRPARVAA